MKSLLLLLVLPALALAPGTAIANSKAKVYKGTFTLVGADGDYVTGNFGKVQLVDNKRNDKVSVHVRRLARKVTYTYKLQQGVCKEGAPGGTDVGGFTYKPLKTNRKGIGNSTARSKTFASKRDVTYSVVVIGGGEVLLCAQLRTNDWPKAHGKSETSHGKAEDNQKGKSDDAPGQAVGDTGGKPDEAPGQAEDKTRGKSDDAPGQADDKTRGKSDDAPRGNPHGQGKPKG
jgi:hypothetical protein